MCERIKGSRASETTHRLGGVGKGLQPDGSPGQVRLDPVAKEGVRHKDPEGKV